MKCAICEQDGQHMGRCVACNLQFCNKAIEKQANHVLRHVAETGHSVFEFPEVGIPKCAKCECQDIMRLYQDENGAFLCDMHKQTYCRKISIGKIVFRKPDADKQQSVLFRELLCAGEAQRLNEELLVIPDSFPQQGRDVCYVGGIPAVYKKLRAYVDSHQIQYSDGKYISSIPELQQRIGGIEKEQYNYQQFFDRAVSAERQYEVLQSQVLKQKVKSEDLTFKASASGSYEVTIRWSSKKKLCGEKVKSGSIISIIAKNSERTLEFTGPVQLLGTQLFIKTIEAPASEDMPEQILTLNNFQFWILTSDKRIMREKQLLAVALLNQNQSNFACIFKSNVNLDKSGIQASYRFMRTTEEAESLLQLLREELVRKQWSNNVFLPNETQSKAIRHSLINRVSLIQGCPGGGKTYTAALLVECLLLAYSGGRILCCAGSNTAADNLVEMLDRIGIKALRVYARTKEECLGQHMPEVLRKSALHVQVQEQLQPVAFASKAAQTRSIIALENYLIKSASVVVATCACTCFSRFKGQYFDAVLIDEASHIIEPEAILPILLTDSQVILIGDQQQLGPIVKNPVARQAGLGVTLFDRLNKLSIPFVKLMQQYRMHPALLELPNRLFYNEKIQSMVGAENRSILTEKCNLQSPLARLLQNQPFMFWHISSKEELAQGTTSYQNQAEANCVAMLVHALVKDLHVPITKIGVITPYSAQQILLERFFSQSDKPEIDSVDAFQGREKEVIVFSCVRSNDEGTIGFLSQRRRLNVAMTRARRALLIVGNAQQLAEKSKVWGDVVAYYAQKQQLYAGDSLENLIPVPIVQENADQNEAVNQKSQVENPYD